MPDRPVAARRPDVDPVGAPRRGRGRARSARHRATPSMPGVAVPVAVPELAVVEDREDLELVDGPGGRGRRRGERPAERAPAPTSPGQEETVDERSCLIHREEVDPTVVPTRPRRSRSMHWHRPWREAYLVEASVRRGRRRRTRRGDARRRPSCGSRTRRQSRGPGGARTVALGCPWPASAGDGDWRSPRGAVLGEVEGEEGDGMHGEWTPWREIGVRQLAMHAPTGGGRRAMVSRESTLRSRRRS